jgi:hypothetical protein
LFCIFTVRWCVLQGEIFNKRVILYYSGERNVGCVWWYMVNIIRLTEISEIMSVLTSEGLWQTLSDWDIRDNICFDILKLFYIYHISSYTAFISLSRIIQNDSFIKDFTLQYTSSNCKYTKQKFISWILTYFRHSFATKGRHWSWLYGSWIYIYLYIYIYIYIQFWSIN